MAPQAPSVEGTQAGKVVAATNTVLPAGVTQLVPPLTKATLLLPTGKPEGHCTFWLRWVQQPAAAAGGDSRTAATSSSATAMKKTICRRNRMLIATSARLLETVTRWGNGRVRAHGLSVR